MSEVEVLFWDAHKLIDSKDDDPRPPTLAHLKTLRDQLRKDGPERWTEFAILPLEQTIIDHLRIEDLVELAHSRLEDLKSYKERRADVGYFKDQERRINDLIEEAEQRSAKEKKGLRLRAALRSLVETVADYDANWAVGFVIIRGLLIATALTLPILLLMGIAPWVFGEANYLNYWNWSLLGASGSLASLLLYFRKSNIVEVGDSEGRNELWRGIGGGVLGFVAGFVAYSIVGARLVEKGYVVPDLHSASLEHIGLSVMWAFVAGFSFERVFELVKREGIE